MSGKLLTVLLLAAIAGAAPASAHSAPAAVRRGPAVSRHLTTSACAGSAAAHNDSDTNSTALSGAECAAWQAGFDVLGGGAGWNKCGDKRDDPCGCIGVKCVDGNITSVDLRQNSMAGEPPKAWGNLTELTFLNLNGNELTGDLPKEWAALLQLMSLSLSKNRLAGELPKEWAVLVQLKYLYLYGNKLTGEIPKEWAALTQLDNLNLNINQLAGIIHVELVGTLFRETGSVLSTNRFRCPAAGGPPERVRRHLLPRREV
jgi:Leucine-rich repeat (LRR) protein